MRRFVPREDSKDENDKQRGICRKRPAAADRYVVVSLHSTIKKDTLVKLHMHMVWDNENSHFLPEASFGLRVLSLSVPACASVCAVITCLSA